MNPSRQGVESFLSFPHCGRVTVPFRRTKTTRAYLGGITPRGDRDWQASGDSRDKPRRGVFRRSAGIRPTGWVGPRFCMHCSKTSLRPRLHPLPESLATNVPLAKLPAMCLCYGHQRCATASCPSCGPSEDICPAIASLITTLVHPVAVNVTLTWVGPISLRRQSRTCYLKTLEAEQVPSKNRWLVENFPGKP